MINQGIHVVLHYLDDYFFMSDPGSEECADALRLALVLCEWLGVPVAEGKVEGPDTSLIFLGIQLDTVSWVLRLPEEKLRRLRVLISGSTRNRALNVSCCH